LVRLRAEIKLEGKPQEVKVLKAALKPEVNRMGIRGAEIKMLESEREVIIVIESSSLTKTRAVLDSIIKWSIIVLKTYNALTKAAVSPFGHTRGENISSNTKEPKLPEDTQEEGRSNTKGASQRS